jgi:hypothetical protein
MGERISKRIRIQIRFYSPDTESLKMPSEESPDLKLTVDSKATENPSNPKLVKPETHASLPYEPRVRNGWVDVTGIIPEGIHVDANITERHPNG